VEFQRYLSIIRRWAWLLILGLVLGAAVGYGVSISQVPVYEAATRVLAVRTSQTTSSDQLYYTAQDLADTYVQLLTTKPVLDGASQKLGFQVDAGQLNLQTVGTTGVIRLAVEDTDPDRAAAIANAIVQSLIEQNQDLQAGQYADTEKSLQEQIAQTQDQIIALQSEVNQASTKTVQEQLSAVRAQIDPLQAEVAALQKEIAAAQPSTAVSNRVKIAADQARLDEIQPVLSLYQQIYSNLLVLGQPSDQANSDSVRLAQLKSTLDLYQQVYGSLLTNLQSVRLARLQNTPTIVQIEAAVKPNFPVRPKPLSNALLAAMVGLMIAGGIAFVVEYLDDTLKTPEDVQRLLNLSVIGFIGEMPEADKAKTGVYALVQPRSPISEAFRSLRTNLEFSSVDRPLRKLLVTSASPNDGKTTVAVNLAVIIAQGGKHVVLVDADLRKPRVHTFVGLPNRTGLSDLFRGAIPSQLAMQRLDGSEVAVITSGSLPPNPSELLASARMDQILTELTGTSDTIVLDSPPALVTDIQILAAKADGVLVVVRPGRTKTQAARATLEQLRRTGARVLGVVFNGIPRSRPYYYGAYQQYAPYSKGGYGYYADDDLSTDPDNGGGKRRRRADKISSPDKLAKAD
jgi:tyrosine-protein kinase